jgi:hypothetical protein
MLETALGLRRWTAFHDHWQEDVGSLAVTRLPDPLCAQPSAYLIE